MKLMSRTKPVDGLGDEDLRRRVEQAEKTIAEIKATPAAEVVRAGRADETLRLLEREMTVVEVGKAELDEVAAARSRSALENAPVRAAVREREDERDARQKVLIPIRRALGFGMARAHVELAGQLLVVDRLSAEEGEELVEIVDKMRDLVFKEDAPALTDEETVRYEQLLGVAAGDPELFVRERKRTAANTKIAELAKARKRLPQSESLVAAVMGDPALFDLLHQRVRTDVRLVDELGNESRGATTDRILELEHISTLFTIVSLIVENGGREITVTDRGFVRRTDEDGRLPFLTMKTLPQLKRNEFITVRREGSDVVIGVGNRVRKIAKRWGIKLMESTT